MSCAVVIRRIRAALAALAVLAFIAATAAAAVPLAGEDNELNITIDMKVTVKSDDTFEASFVITDQTNYSWAPPITEDRCTLNYFLVEPNIFANAETRFDGGKDKRVCTITRKGKISDTNGTIRHESDEYAIDTSSMDGRKTPPPELHLSYTATFPGEVTQSEGGIVEGNEKSTVSFTDFKGRVVKGKDRPASEATTSKVLPWIIGGVGSLLVIGLIAMAVFVRRRQRNRQGVSGPGAQALPTQSPVSQQPYLGQPAPQQYPMQPTPPHFPSGIGNGTSPPFPAQAPQQHGQWPSPPQPQ